MSLNSNNTPFDAERARRYKLAMDTCPAARYLEILPLFCLFAHEGLSDWDITDLGAGTGYLANFFEAVSHSVLLVDKSPDQLRESGRERVVVSDMCTPAEAVGVEVADLITCLASFHHVHVPPVPDRDTLFISPATRTWTPERCLDLAASQAQHRAALHNWVRMLKPGGWLALIDIPGYPDPAWQAAWPTSQPHTVNTRLYHAQALPELERWPLHMCPAVLERLFTSNACADFWASDPHLAALRRLVDAPSFSMADLVRSYGLPLEVLKQSGPMAPADFFDDVVDRYGIQPHYGYFPRETSTRRILEEAGLEQVHAITLPTPWVFDSRETATWFVHELLGLGTFWPRAAIPAGELAQLQQLLDDYLGFFTDAYGRTMLFWQLGYMLGRKPSC